MAGHRAAVRVGFVGTSDGLTPRQLTRIWELSVGFAATDLHHGNRRGTDAQVHHSPTNWACGAPSILTSASVTRWVPVRRWRSPEWAETARMDAEDGG